MTATTPVFSELARDEIDALLARNNVGRIAYTFHDRVDIEPINHVYADGWIYGRTSHSSELETIAHHRWVAFAVDEARGIFDWRSVVVRGAVYFLTPGAHPTNAHSFEHGLALLRELLPGTVQANDPVPFRHVVFRIHLDEVTGRAAKPGTLQSDG